MRSSLRRIRSRAPACVSTGLGCFLAIAFPREHSFWMLRFPHASNTSRGLMALCAGLITTIGLD
jgi:hypothetical protein